MTQSNIRTKRANCNPTQIQLAQSSGGNHMNNRWSKEKAWEWYDNMPWLRGCNYMSADCANRIDQLQSFEFEKRFETTKKELALAEELGFNTIRMIIEYVVWKEEHDTYFERLDRYLDLCASHGISVMVTLANDCMPEKNEFWKLPAIGKQHYDWGYHGGRSPKTTPHTVHLSVHPHYYLDDPETADDYFKMVTEIVTRYKDDSRVCIWDVYNEAGSAHREALALPLLERMFATVRSCNPSQPLTACIWRYEKDHAPSRAITEYLLETCDIISYHFYGNLKEHVKIIKDLKKAGRPIINTEWLARCMHNTVFELFPLFYLEKIGCYNWGFVAGKYQTYEPWEASWLRYEDDPTMDFDFTKWFHDLYRPNHRPYDPKEVELIKHFCKLADEEFAEEQQAKNA